MYSQQIEYAGEYAAASELLFRNYTTEGVKIDFGVDLVCWTNSGSKQIQVKTRKEREARPRFFVHTITRKSFSIPDYFVFVARRLDGRTDFVVIPKSLLASLRKKGDVKLTKRGSYRVNLAFGRGEKVWIQKRENDVTPYLNTWVI